MLLNWVDTARNLGMKVETLYSTKQARFTVRVYDLQVEAGQLVATAGKQVTS